MATKITIVDDGGPVRARLSVNVAPGLGHGDATALVAIGELEIRVAFVDRLAAERCQAIAAEFQRIALELLPQRLDSRAHLGDGDGAAREARAFVDDIRADRFVEGLAVTQRYHGEILIGNDRHETIGAAVRAAYLAGMREAQS